MLFKRLVKDSAIYGGADFIGKLLSFVAFPFIAAVLSPQAFGILELIGTVTALLGLAVNCGLNNSVQRFYWDNDATRTLQSTIVTSGFYAQAIFGLLTIVIVLIFVPWISTWIEQKNWPLTWIALVSALLLMVLTQWSQYVLDVLRLRLAPWGFLVLSMTARGISVATGVVAVVVLEAGIDGWLAAQALVMLLALPLALWMIREDFKWQCLDRKWLGELVQFGYPFIFVGIAYWLFGSMDRWMLASMASVEEVGIYSVALRFASIVLFVSAAFGQAWSPVAIKIKTDHPEQYSQIYGQVLILLLFAMLMIGGGVALFSGELMSIIMPVDYLSAALPLTILCFGIALQATQQVTAVGISLEKKTYLFARLAWLTALLNLVLNWLLIPSFGGVGAAWATFVSYLVLTVSYLYFTQILHPMQIQWKSLFTIFALGVLLMGVAVCFVTPLFDFKVVIMKLAVAMCCFVIGWSALPVKSLKRL